MANQVSLVRSINPGNSDITFHIVAGLAGGTGSGSIVDVVAQLRKTYQPNLGGGVHFKILPYLFIPEQLPKPGWDAGFYHANGFAALSELNAMALGLFKPVDINGNGEVVDISDHGDFFTGAYLFSNINEEGVIMDTKDVLPGIVADFLFQKINLVGGGTQQNAIERTETYENVLSKIEIEDGAKVRSRNFFSFGIKRIEIPEEEIVEYFTFNFSKQALLQFKFNNWSDDLGFRNQARNIDLHSYINDKNTLSNWFISDDHLVLSVPILQSDKSGNWKTIIEDWNAIIPSLKSTAWENSSDKTSPINQLSKFCEERFDKNFRRVGVSEFYKTKKLAKKDIAKEICQTIEKNMFDDWRSGQKSLTEIAATVELLLTNLENRLNGLSDKINKISNTVEELIKKKQQSELEWSKINLMERALGKGKRVFEGHGVILQQLYTQKTLLEAWGFGKELLAEVLNQLQLLASEVVRFSDKIAVLIINAEKTIETRCQDEKLDADSFRKPVIRYYESAIVRNFTTRLIRDENIQKRQSSEIRNLLVAKIGDEPTFTKLNERISDDFFTDTLEVTCKQNALAAHNELLTNRSQKIIGVNILEKLCEQFGQDQNALKDFARNIIKYSGTLLSFNRSQESLKSDPGDGIGVNLKRAMLSISIPNSSEISPNFKQALETAFKESTSNPNVLFDYSGKQNEIVVVSTVCAFPLRFINDLGYLRQKHETLLKSGNESGNEHLSRMVLYLEGDGSNLPKLFPLSDTEKAAKRDAFDKEEAAKRDAFIGESLPIVIIAKAMNIIQRLDRSDGTGKMVYGISQVDEFGMPIGVLALGEMFTGCTERLDEILISTLKNDVTTRLAGEYLHYTKREELQKQIIANVTEIILPECKGNANNPTYKRFYDATRKAIETLKN